MSFEYIDVDAAIARRGLRMVVVGGVPSPWGEAAKGILHVKGIEWAAVRLAYDSEPLKRWAGQRSGPVAVYDDGIFTTSTVTACWSIAGKACCFRM